MTKLHLPALFTGSLLLLGCTPQTGWVPTVDTYNKPNAYRLNQDLADCQQVASQKSDTTQLRLQADGPFRNAYHSCLRQRGHTVIN